MTYAVNYNHYLKLSIDTYHGFFNNSANAFNQSLAKWDVSNVIDMDEMFSNIEPIARTCNM